MKKIIFIVGGMLILTLLLVWPWRIRVSKEVVVRASLFDVGPQLTDVGNWKHWYPDAAGHTFVITANNPAAVVVKVDNSDYLSLMAMPEKDISYTRVSATRVVSLGEWIKGDGGVIGVGLDSLKKFLEDPVTHYGFDISIQPVKDTLIMTVRDTVAPDQVSARFIILQQQLIGYLGKKRALSSAFDLYMVNEPVSKDRVLVAVGIPVSLVLPDEKGFENLRFPVNGRILVGRYHGPFSALSDLRRAMDKYIQDQHLTKVALPFTRTHVKLFEASQANFDPYELDYPIY